MSRDLQIMLAVQALVVTTMMAVLVATVSRTDERIEGLRRDMEVYGRTLELTNADIMVRLRVLEKHEFGPQTPWTRVGPHPRVPGVGGREGSGGP